MEIHGTRAALINSNGKLGVAIDFHWYEDKSKWRYTVQLDSGEAFKLKLANVRAEEGVVRAVRARGRRAGARARKGSRQEGRVRGLASS